MSSVDARKRIAARGAQELRDGMYVNLGIGILTSVPSFLDPDVQVVLHSENGLLGVGGFPAPEDEAPDTINAGKEPVTLAAGAAVFDSALSFAMVRGGHLDLALPGGMQVSATGDLANWRTTGRLIKGMGGAMPYLIRRAPAAFGPYGGDIFFPGQAKGGREGALSGHRLYRLTEGESAPETFVDIPHAGTTGGGTPGAMMVGGFGREGTPHEGTYLCQTMMNCVIYQITPDRECRLLFILEEVFGRPVMPYFLFYATSVWGPELDGKLPLGGMPDASFEIDDPGHNILEYYVIDGDRIDPEPVARRDIGWAMAEVAPPEFGPYGGHTFLFDFGATNFMHVSKAEPGPLPYDSRILRVDPSGETHVFADGLQGGWNELRFDRDRMYISCLRRSFSTGEYHEPDGSLYEIRVKP